jgi:cell division protein FtsI (penicillin-binding protein 3)
LSADGQDDPDAPSPASLARRFGAPREATVPMLETVRVTAPDLKRRAALEKTRGRLVFTALGFAVLFTLVLGKLADKTIINPVEPRHEAAFQMPALDQDGGAGGTLAATPISTLATPAGRAKIVDRNGEELAISLPMAELYANPKEMIDQADAAHRIKQVLPRLDEAELRARLTSNKKFVYLARQLTPREELAVNDLGIPGVYFMPSDHRDYPFGNVAAQVLGGVDVDGHGVAGIEKYFDQRLRDNAQPLRLSLDVHVQAVVRDELSKAKDEFRAIGACGIVMDVRTGEVLAMVNLPDYDANKFGQSPPDDRFNRAVTGMYEPGSTFKLQTAAMALDYGTAQIWSEFDASQPIRIGRFTITDFEGKHRWLYLPEVLAYSSNLGAAHIAMTVGAERQRAWLGRMGMLGRLGIELPEAGRPIAPPVANWGEAAVMTIGFGHGIAVSPLHVVRGTAAVANGGILLRPTLLAMPPDATPQGERVMASATSDIVRKLMRLVVTAGYGKAAEVPGYFVGGKTGTAEKVGHGVYRKHANVSAFISVFPMNAPRYAVYMMLDEPQADASTHGYTTAGWVSAPAAGRVIARIGPLLGLLPQTANAAEIEASLAIPLQPGHPPGARTIPLVAEPPPKPGAAPKVAEDPTRKGHPKQPAVVAPVSAAPAAPAAITVPRDLRHEAMYQTPGSQADGVAVH